MRHSSLLMKLGLLAGVLCPAVGQAADDGREALYKQYLKESRKSGSSLEARELVANVGKLTDLSIGESDFSLATKSAQLAVDVAEKTGNGLLAFQTQRKKQQVATAARTATRLARHFKKLKTEPDDPVANLEVGKFVCGLKDDWPGGCEHLMKSGAESWTSAAALELSTPTDSEQQLSLAQKWSELSVDAGGELGAAFSLRAVHWAREAKRQSVGAARDAADEVLLALPVVYLVDMTEADVKAGPWPVGKGEKGNGMPIEVGQIPVSNGIGQHAGDRSTVSISYRLDGHYKSFQWGGAISDHTFGDPRPVNFQVWGDGKPLWKSGMITRFGQAEFCNVPVKGVRVLELRIQAPVDAFGDHTCWIHPQVWK
jgi:hypothetical protein